MSFPGIPGAGSFPGAGSGPGGDLAGMSEQEQMMVKSVRDMALLLRYEYF